MHARQERRRVPRKRFRGRIVAQIDERLAICSGENISESGMLICSESQAFLRGSAIRLSFSLPGQLEPFTLEARIRRRELVPGDVGRDIAWKIALAVEFRRVAPWIRRVLRTFVYVGDEKVRIVCWRRPARRSASPGRLRDFAG